MALVDCLLSMSAVHASSPGASSRSVAQNRYSGACSEFVRISHVVKRNQSSRLRQRGAQIIYPRAARIEFEKEETEYEKEDQAELIRRRDEENVRNREALKLRRSLETGPTQTRGLTREPGVGQGGQWLSSTTRHVRLYIGVADPVTKALDQQQLDKLTLMLDPDNEFVWPEDKVQKVYAYLEELVDVYDGAPMTEYTLRLIGSDLEHFIRKLLLANEIQYNLNCRVLNFSMGMPRIDPATLKGVEDV